MPPTTKITHRIFPCSHSRPNSRVAAKITLYIGCDDLARYPVSGLKPLSRYLRHIACRAQQRRGQGKDAESKERRGPGLVPRDQAKRMKRQHDRGFPRLKRAPRVLAVKASRRNDTLGRLQKPIRPDTNDLPGCAALQEAGSAGPIRARSAPIAEPICFLVTDEPSSGIGTYVGERGRGAGKAGVPRLDRAGAGTLLVSTKKRTEPAMVEAQGLDRDCRAESQETDGAKSLTWQSLHVVVAYDMFKAHVGGYHAGFDLS